MYKSIYVPVDNSDLSNRAVACALGLGKAYQAKMVGCHVYAAKLHDYRFQADGVHAARGVHRRGGAGAPAEDPRQPHHDGPQAHFRQLPRWHVAPMWRVGPRVRAADDGREASHRDPQGSRRLTARPGRDRRPGDRARPGQRDRLGLRTRRPPIGPRSLGRQARPGTGRGGAGHDPGRPRRQPPVIRRAHDRRRSGTHVRQEGRDDRRVRSLPALLRLQRPRQRPHRTSGEGFPLRGAESAPRGDHRHRARADLSVSSRGGRADGERGGHRDQENAPRRQALPEDPRPRAQDESLAHRAGRIGVHSPKDETGLGSNAENILRGAPCGRPPVHAPRGTTPRRARRGDRPMDARGRGAHDARSRASQGDRPHRGPSPGAGEGAFGGHERGD